MSRSTRKLRRKPRYESLETRRLLAGDISFDAVSGVLTIDGTDEYSECAEVVVDYKNTWTWNDDEIVATVKYNPSGATTDCGDDDELASLAPHVELRSAVTSIKFYGRGKSDQFTNDSHKPSYAEGGNGNDVLTGGNLQDTLVGGHGNDALYGREGDDVLRGGDKNSLNGNLHHHDGPDGNDRLYGGDDDDILKGGTGDDQLYGQGGIDVLYGGHHNDKLDGGVDDGEADTLEGGPHSSVWPTETFVPDMIVSPEKLNGGLHLESRDEFVDCSNGLWGHFPYGDIVQGYSGENAVALCKGEKIEVSVNELITFIWTEKTTPMPDPYGPIVDPTVNMSLGTAVSQDDVLSPWEKFCVMTSDASRLGGCLDGVPSAAQVDVLFDMFGKDTRKSPARRTSIDDVEQAFVQLLSTQEWDDGWWMLRFPKK